MKDKMTPTPWRFDDQSLNGPVIRGNDGIIILKDHRTEILDMPNVVSAVNNTYGVGVNPEAIPDMLAALKAVLEHEHHIQPASNFNQVPFDKMDLVKAAIEKAKL